MHVCILVGLYHECKYTEYYDYYKPSDRSIQYALRDIKAWGACYVRIAEVNGNY